MKTLVTKWGNSLAVRLPKPYTDQIGISSKSEIEITVLNDQIILKKPKEDLKQMLSKVTPENIHKETDTDEITGKEIW